MSTTLIRACHFRAVVLAVASIALAHVIDALPVPRTTRIASTTFLGTIFPIPTLVALAHRLPTFDDALAMAGAVVWAHVKGAIIANKPIVAVT
jgi:hypothetical protein